MNRKLKVKAGRGWDVRLADAYAYTSAAVCAAMGLLMLYGTSVKDRVCGSSSPARTRCLG